MKVRKLLMLAVVMVMALSWMGITACAEEDRTIAVGEVKTATVKAIGGDVDTDIVFQFTPTECGMYALYVEESYDYGQHNLFIDAYEDGCYIRRIAYKNIIVFEGSAGRTCDLVINCYGYLHQDLELSLRVEPWNWQYLNEGENDVNWNDDLAQCKFEPEKDGYYCIFADDPSVSNVNVFATQVSDGGETYFTMEAGQVYDVDIFGKGDTVNTKLYIEYYEAVDVIIPVSMELISLPYTPVYPWQAFTGNPDYEVDFAGLAIQFTWNTGEVTQWDYSRDGLSLGDYSVDLGFEYDGEIVTITASLHMLDVEPVSFEFVRVYDSPETPANPEPPEIDEPPVDPEPPENVEPPANPEPPENVELPANPEPPEIDEPPANSEPPEKVEFSEVPETSKNVGTEVDAQPQQIELLRENGLSEGPKAAAGLETGGETAFGSIDFGLVVLTLILLVATLARVVWMQKKKA